MCVFIVILNSLFCKKRRSNRDLLGLLLCFLMLNTCQLLQQASTLPFKVSVYHNILARIKDSVADARFLGVSSFKVWFLPEIILIQCHPYFVCWDFPPERSEIVPYVLSAFA